MQALPQQDAVVILQKDSEGNGYSPLSGVDAESVYKADSTYSGEVYRTDDEYAPRGAVPCCVLFPIN